MYVESYNENGKGTQAKQNENVTWLSMCFI